VDVSKLLNRRANARAPTPLVSPRIFAVANLKGGVGKTTTALNLGAAWAELRRKVLLIDLDPSATLTRLLGVPIDEDDPDLPSAYTLLRPTRRSTLEEVVCRTPLGLPIVPSTQELDKLPFLLHDDPSWGTTLARALGPTLPYEIVVLDCPPESIILTYLALGAATDAVVVLQPEGPAVMGAVQMNRRIDAIRESSPKLVRHRLVVNMDAPNQRLAQGYVAGLTREFPDLVCATIIPRRVAVAEAMSAGLPVTAYAPRSPAARAYRKLAAELLDGGAR
jgi:chromosome partitioning protein